MYLNFCIPFTVLILVFFFFQLLYVSSNYTDYQKEFKDSLMYRYVVDFHINCILLNITIPPLLDATATPISELTGARETERLRREGGMVINIISTNKEKMGEGRSKNKLNEFSKNSSKITSNKNF